MVPALALRTKLLIAAGGLSAVLSGCSSLSRTVVVDEQRPATIALVSRSSPTLVLRNKSNSTAVDPRYRDAIVKQTSDAGMQALLDTFDDQQLFARCFRSAPSNARQSLVLKQGDQAWVWVFGSNSSDPRAVAYLQARSFFLQLFNGSPSYQQTDEARDMQEAARKAQMDAARQQFNMRRRRGNSGNGDKR